jgi:hypothetical protein
MVLFADCVLIMPGFDYRFVQIFNGILAVSTLSICKTQGYFLVPEVLSNLDFVLYDGFVKDESYLPYRNSLIPRSAGKLSSVTSYQPMIMSHDVHPTPLF